MVEQLKLVPTWSFAVRVYTEVLQNPDGPKEVKQQVVKDLMDLAQSYEALSASFTALKAENEQLKTRINTMLEQQSEEYAKAAIASAQQELLQDTMQKRGVYDFRLASERHDDE